jgi:hypothetical protein
MASRVKIKVGSIEVEYEGEEQFIKDELLNLVKAAVELLQEAGPLVPPPPAAGNASNAANQPGQITESSSMIAAKLGKSGCDILLAAAGYHSLNAGKTKFTRDELLTMMKDTNGYKSSMSRNLTNYLKTALKGDLNHIGGGLLFIG